MTFKPKTQTFNPAVLPMEYLPRVLDASTTSMRATT